MSVFPQVTDGRATCDPNYGTAKSSLLWIRTAPLASFFSYKQLEAGVVLNIHTHLLARSDMREVLGQAVFHLRVRTHAHSGGVSLSPTHTLPHIWLLTYSLLSSQDIASPKFSMPSPVRTVIAADFDNDQELEIFFNNFAHRSSSANRLFR